MEMSNLLLTEEQQLPSQLKILFVDDHIGLRDAIINMLNQKNPHLLFIPATNKEEAIEVVNNHSDLRLVIMDLNLNGTNGLDVVKEIKEIQENLSVLIYTMFNDPIHIEQSFRCDVQGYISKDATIDELYKAINTVISGDLYYNQQARKILKVILNKGTISAEGLINSTETDSLYKTYLTLTQKEKDVFYYLAQKKDPDEIAKILGKSQKTVINQKSIIYSKMNIRDRLELLEKAKLLGLIV